MFNWMRPILLILAFMAAPVAQATLPAGTLQNVAPSLNPMLQKVMPSVVNIVGTGHEGPMPPEHGPRGPSEDPRRQRSMESMGSGVIVDADKGYIVTNAHVINQSRTITVNLSDGRRFKAKLIGADALTDIAVIQIDANKLNAMPLADSTQVRVGDFVVAIGNPFGLSQTVTSGIVSALERGNFELAGPHDYESFIQTDAPINPGNSGGALVNMKGELIGINTAILAPNGGNIGIGFAIPSNMAKAVMQQLIQNGSLKRGVVGIIAQNLTPELANAYGQPELKGAIVSQVRPGSSAAKGGLQAGDIILQINGAPVRTALEVRNTIGLTPTGSTVAFDLFRKGKRLQAKVVSEDAHELMAHLQSANQFLFGLSLEDFNQYNAAQGRVQGAIVVQIMENSPAWHAGMVPGDVIVSANLKPVRNVEELQQAAAQASGYLLVNVKRDEGGLFLPIKAKE